MMASGGCVAVGVLSEYGMGYERKKSSCRLGSIGISVLWIEE